MTGVVRVEREIPVPPEDVFDAWTDPESLSIWMAPPPIEVGEAECDPQVGGRFRIVMVDPTGAMEHYGVYEVVDRPHRLVFSWRAEHLGTLETRVRVELTPTDTGTRMVIEHEGLPVEVQPPHAQGWGGIADKLAAVLGTSA